MKLKIFSRYFPPDFVGGAELSTFHVVKALQDKFEIEINTLSRINSHAFKIRTLKNVGAVSEMFPNRYSSRIQRRNKIQSTKDIIWNADFFGAIATYGLQNKKILTVRDYWPICPCEVYLLKNHCLCPGCSVKNQLNCMKIKESPLSKKLIRIIRYRLYYSFNQQLLRDSDHVVFISNYQADKIISRIPLESYSVIYNPLSAEYLTKLPDKKITKKILYVGAVKAYKGIDIILDAMPGVLKQHKNIHLTVAGTGDVTKYQNKAKALSIAENITFTDKVPPEKLIDLYDQADILVAPSIRPEPFGRTIIEGMARQCVPVASNHGGPTEIIQDGKTGFLSRVGDFRHLSELIALLYNDGGKLSEICHRARIDSIKRFNPALIAEKYGKIFTNTINNTKLF